MMPRMFDPADQFDDFGRDFEGLCVYAELAGVVGHALSQEAGVSDEDYDEDEWVTVGAAAINALLEAGFLRREWFKYIDPVGTVTT